MAGYFAAAGGVLFRERILDLKVLDLASSCPVSSVFQSGVFLCFSLLAAVADDAVPMKLEALPLRVPAPVENPTTPEKAALGRLLFFDPVLSGTQAVACATCHHPAHGWADGRATPIGAGGAGLGPARRMVHGGDIKVLMRNTPTLLNVGFNGLITGDKTDPAAAPMFWDARVQGLEAQVFKPVQSADEMRGAAGGEAGAMEQAASRVRAIPEYRALFARTVGEVTPQHLAQAIAAFERSLVAADSPFDRFMRGDPGALRPQQQRGMATFQKAGCNFCHGGPMFSDFKLHFIGVGDERREFRTPTLRNLRHTAPYMHNGSQRTLQEVMVFYELLMDSVSETVDGGDKAASPPLDPLLKRLAFTVADEPDLIAFLDSLNDDSYDKSIPEHVPSGLKVAGE